MFLRVLPTRWRRIPADIDMEENYVTLIQCIAPFAHGAFHAEMLQVLVIQVQAHVQSLHRYSLPSDM